MSANTALIILSSIIVFSYIIEVISRKLKLPSVILLLITGIVAKVVIESYGVQFNYLDKILPILGTIGLILIVFEGSLELKYDKSKNKLILGAFLSAITILLFTVLSIGFILNYITYQPLHTCMINAVPFGVISSAVAIPSTYSFSTKYREFIIYESSFSDILGIIVFNFFIHNSSIESSSFLHLGLEIFLVLFISILFCFLLLFILRNLKLQVRFILIIAILFLIYAIGKHYHLSSLLIVLLFGLFLANIEKINFKWIHRYFLYPNFLNDFNQLHQISLEAAFLIRTFFFIIFGLTINLTEITSLKIIEYGIVITISIFLIRLVYLKYVAKFTLSPLVYMSPRGLISILLFFSIPEQYKIHDIESGILFLVILSTSIIMTFGVLTYRKSD
jgi:NhaP-type Na+/H+ or K+/H+ antiporter